MLIRHADIWGHGLADLRIAGSRIAAIGQLTPEPGERIVEARGGALLPGLHDHHIHLPALAARRESVACGPPQVSDEAELAAALSRPGTGWLRGIGYHESVAGMLDRQMLDRIAPDRPLRIQHRSGRMWFLNSAALDVLLGTAAAPRGLDRATGQLFDEDRWMREALGSTPPDFAALSADLARMGVTGITDMTPSNDDAAATHFADQRATGRLAQHVLLAGTLALSVGLTKVHLHEADLPDYDHIVAVIAAAHARDRAVAIHCVTETELVFALAALAEAGVRPGDRIEHASIAPDRLVAEIGRLGLAVVSQPHFIAERGDQYREAVEPDSVPHLYRLRAFLDAGVTLAGGSDAPFGEPDPWASMRAAVSRRTSGGQAIGAGEALSPEQALALFLADPVDLSRQRQIDVGAPADLCLLDRPWSHARQRLLSGDVRATLIAGGFVHDRVDQTP
ncbi:MAG: amidohydrolase family protein [Sphingobium sp.]